MRKAIRIFLRIILYLLLFLLAVLIIVRFTGILDFRKPDSEILSSIPEGVGQAVIDTIQWAEGNLAYLSISEQNSERPNVVFVHGAPGSLDAFMDYMRDSELRSKADLYAIDRPGYGGSSPGVAVSSLKKQADAIYALTSTLKGPTILVGHSLGGPIVARYAARYPQNVWGIVLVAASVDPDLEPGTWWRKLIRGIALDHLLPVSFRVCNDELLPLKAELQELQGYWDDVQAKTIIVHGTRDRLVPYENAAFMMEEIPGYMDPELIELEGSGHFILWSELDLIIAEILDLLNQPASL